MLAHLFLPGKSQSRQKLASFETDKYLQRRRESVTTRDKSMDRHRDIDEEMEMEMDDLYFPEIRLGLTRTRQTFHGSGDEFRMDR